MERKAGRRAMRDTRGEGEKAEEGEGSEKAGSREGAVEEREEEAAADVWTLQ